MATVERMNPQQPAVAPAPPVPNVYQCIAAVSAEIARTGISKDRKNEQQGYKFRGIDDIYNALAPVLAKHQLVILPRMLSREQTERQTAKGGVLFSVVVDAEFDFVSAADGSKHTTKAFGEAMDSADKATNKAMSAAYKYTAFQTFCIPTEGDNDADAHTQPTIVATAPTTPTIAQTPAGPRVPDGYDDWLTDLAATADEGWPKMRDTFNGSPDVYRGFLTQKQNATWEALKRKAAAKSKEQAVKS